MAQQSCSGGIERARERPINRSAENDKIECESCVRAREFYVGMAALVERICESNLDEFYSCYCFVKDTLDPGNSY